MLKNEKNNGTEEVGLVTSTLGPPMFYPTLFQQCGPNITAVCWQFSDVVWHMLDPGLLQVRALYQVTMGYTPVS